MPKNNDPIGPCINCETMTSRQARLNDKLGIDSKMPFRFVCKDCDPHFVKVLNNPTVQGKCFRCGIETRGMARVTDDMDFDSKLPFRSVCHSCMPKAKLLQELAKDPAKDNPFPWKRPSGKNKHYQTDGPDREVIFKLEGVTLKVTPTKEEGITTGRTRFRVACVSCDSLLHHGITFPASACKHHVLEDHKCFKCGKYTSRRIRISDTGKIDMNLPLRPMCNKCAPSYELTAKVGPVLENESKKIFTHDVKGGYPPIFEQQYVGGRTEDPKEPEGDKVLPTDMPEKAFYSPKEKMFYTIEKDGTRKALGTWAEFSQEVSDSNPTADPLDYEEGPNAFSELHQKIADSRTTRILEIEAEKLLDKTMRIDRLAETVWTWVCSVGWHNKSHLECLALISSEVGEAVNAWRDGSEDFHGELVDILFRVLDLLHNTDADIIVEIQKRLERNKERGTRGREK